MPPKSIAFLGATLRFLFAIGLCLYCTMYILDRFFPPVTRFNTTATTAMSSSGDGRYMREPTLMEKMLEAWRWKDRERQRQTGGSGVQDVEVRAAPDDRVRGGGNGPGGGRGGTGMGSEQLMMRETSIAETYLIQSHGRDPATSRYNLDQLRVPPSNAIAYERLRFEFFQVAGEYFERDERSHTDPELKVMYTQAKALAESPHSNFEDYANMAEIALLNGDAEAASNWIQIAARAWPRGAHSFKSVYFLALMSDAALGHSDRVLPMVEDFQANYPDWLYAERYMPDIDAIAEVYPDAPLIPLVRGRLWVNVRNYQAAEADWERASEMPGLDAASTERLASWQDALRRERDGRSQP